MFFINQFFLSKFLVIKLEIELPRNPGTKNKAHLKRTENNTWSCEKTKQINFSWKVRVKVHTVVKQKNVITVKNK